MTITNLISALKTVGVIFLSSMLVSSCNTDKDDDFDIPSTYSFTRDGNSTVNYSGQTQRLDMLALMTTYMKSSNTVGALALDAEVLKNMFRNHGSPFSGQSFAKDLKSKCFAADTTMFLGLMDDLAAASAASGTAAIGTAGVLVTGSTDPTLGYRVNANGVELTQVISKGLMGGVFFYQAMESYLTEERMVSTGNAVLASGEQYTDTEHYFDEAF